MANSLSSKKRNRQNGRSRERNKARKTALKSITRKLTESIHDGNKDEAAQTFTRVQKQLDKLAAKKTIHRNTAARRKSRLARRLNAAMK